MSVTWPSGVTFPSGDNAILAVADYDTGGGTSWDGTEGGADTCSWFVVDAIGDMVRASNATETPHAMFGHDEAVVTVGQPSRSITLNGWFGEGDTGQNMLRAAQLDGSELGFLFIRDTSIGNGYAVRVKVGGGEERANAEGGLQPLSFTLAPQADKVDVTNFDSDVPS